MPSRTLNDSDVVSLKGGLVVPVDVLRLAWALEDRGLHLEADGDDLLVGPPGRLSPSDRQAIRLHKDALRAVVVYCEQVQ